MNPADQQEYKRLALLIAEQANRLFTGPQYSAEQVELSYKLTDYGDGQGLVVTITASLRKIGSEYFHFQVNVLKDPIEALQRLLDLMVYLEPETPPDLPNFKPKVLN